MESILQARETLPISFEAQCEEVAAWAAGLHTDEAPFHPFAHSLQVFETAMEIADSFEAAGRPVDRRVLGFASILHDILVHLPLNADVVPDMKFDSKEHRSAWLAWDYLISKGYDKETVAQPVYDSIMTTNKDQDCITDTDIILCMADIHNTNEAFATFEDRAHARYREECMFNSLKSSFEEWLPGAMDYLKEHLSPNMPREFIEKALKQIDKLLTKHGLK